MYLFPVEIWNRMRASYTRVLLYRIKKQWETIAARTIDVVHWTDRQQQRNSDLCSVSVVVCSMCRVSVVVCLFNVWRKLFERNYFPLFCYFPWNYCINFLSVLVSQYAIYCVLQLFYSIVDCVWRASSIIFHHAEMITMYVRKITMILSVIQCLPHWASMIK